MLHSRLLCVLFLAPFAIAQARFRDPDHLVPRMNARGAADAATGDLYLLGGRADNVLDLWRLHSGSWQRLADSPFAGQVQSIAFDPVRQRLVAVLAALDDNQRRIHEFDGTSWQARATLSLSAHQLAWDTARQQMLVWSQIPQSTFGGLWRWNGSSLAMVPTYNVPDGQFGFDTARGRAAVASYFGVHEWDGAGWTVVPATMPGIVQPQTTTDPWSGRVVMFGLDYWGGNNVASAWTGQNWTAWSTAGIPARSWPTVVGNAARQRVQLVGGGDLYAHGDTFEFDGTSWQLVTPDTADPVFRNPRMAAVGQGAALLFDGGATNAPVQTARFLNGAWTLLQPSQSPAPRTEFALAGDPATGRAFLFGGQTAGGPVGDFWLWNGTDWQPLPSGPPARARHGLCFDGGRQRVVLYGGTAGNDTWEFDGQAWQQRAVNFPPHLDRAELAWHPLRRRSVLVTFGLVGVEVWEWDGIGWFSTSPPDRPNVSSYLMATYDPVRERIVVVDQRNGTSTLYGNAHEWDGSAWRTFGPEPRLTQATANAGVPGIGVVAQGGIARFATTLTHDHLAAIASFGAPCQTPQWLLSASNQPWLGATYTLRYPVNVGRTALFVTGFSNTSAGGTPLPLDLGAAGLTGCHLYVAPEVVLARTWNNGAAWLDIALPADPAYAGLHVYHQAFVLDSAYYAASQALDLQLGTLW